MVNCSIKSIDTIYNGHRFRSRCEARWAVFFDVCGLHYEYEHEGYVLPNGQWYLPDFWLPKLRWFVEIKGDDPTDEEIDKCSFLSTLRPVLLLAGNPGARYKGYFFCSELSDMSYDDPSPCRFLLCRKCPNIVLGICDDHSNGWLWPNNDITVYSELSVTCSCGCDKQSAEEPKKQLEKAATARF